MSKILVIEPHRILQQAIALALFPEHEVKIASAIPESSELKNFDAAIVDMGSLGEPDGAFAQGIRAVQSWKVPTVWVEGASAGQAPKREKLVAINSPIEKEVLLSALAECLGTPLKAKRNDNAAGQSRTKQSQGAAATAAGEPGVIDLVEVVEEGPGAKQARQKM